MEKEQNDIVRDNTCHVDNDIGPPPIDINYETGQMMWVIKEYKIWAHTYRQAIEIVSLIEQSPENETDI